MVETFLLAVFTWHLLVYGVMHKMEKMPTTELYSREQIESMRLQSSGSGEMVTPSPTWVMLPSITSTPSGTPVPTSVVFSTPANGPSSSPTLAGDLITNSPTSGPDPVVTTQPQPTLRITPSSETTTLKTQTLQIQGAQTQITFLMTFGNYPDFQGSNFVFSVTDPTGKVITINDHLQPGIYFVVGDAYQLLRLNSPQVINGEWQLSVTGPANAVVKVVVNKF